MGSKKTDKLIQKFTEELGLFLSISFGVFLFVLFFQPFQFENQDSNNRLLTIAGLGGIVFLIVIMVRVVYPAVAGKTNEKMEDQAFPRYSSGFIIMVLSSVASVFYIRYVGLVVITFYSTFKVIVICLAPPVILGLYDSFRELKQLNLMLTGEKKIMEKQVEKYVEDIQNKSIEFKSESGTENMTLYVGEVVYIKSADNYVEVVYKEGEIFKKKLIRSTLRNIELQIKQYANFIRCHRICIVNLQFVERLSRDSNNHFLIIKGTNEHLPVSRQYLLKLQESV